MEKQKFEKSSERKDVIKNYSNPEPLNVSHIGKSVTITMVNGRTEAGVLKALGQYMISIELPNKRTLLIYKSAVVTISVM